MRELIQNYKLEPRTFLILSIALFPITLLIGSSFINSSIVLIDILFLFLLIKEKKLNFLKNQSFYILLILWAVLIINMLLSINTENSLSRSIGFIRFIIFIFAIKFILNKNKTDDKLIFVSWSIIFFIVTIDIIFESIFGFNTLGFQSYLPGRVSSFLNDELKIGNFYFGFILLTLSFIYYKLKIDKIFIIFLIFLIFVSFLIGERSNFIKIFIITFLFFLVVDKTILWKKLLLFFITLALIFFTISKNENLKERFYNQIFVNLVEHNYDIKKFFRFTTYGAHYDTAIQIFKNHPYFGVGLKNYRIESGKSKYENPNFIFNEKRKTTHPHQIHFEFLAEMGLFGYISFFIFFFIFLTRSIKIQIKNKNLYHLSSLLFILVSFAPLIPSGSFFTTYGAAIFWLNFAVVESFND
ncbi:O-antigen ligase family protein [Candidatus Pelagibacter sp.]|nr:O-antigen ligase family protein [Candidatus Pelagibacter sp.]